MKRRSLLQTSTIDIISLECHNSHVPMDLLELIRGKKVMVGAIDVANHTIETPEEVAATLRKALQFVDADKLYPSTNCGMAPLPRQVASGKLNALSAGAGSCAGNCWPNNLTSARRRSLLWRAIIIDSLAPQRPLWCILGFLRDASHSGLNGPSASPQQLNNSGTLMSPDTARISEIIDRARISPYQILILTLCFLIALLDGFDTAIIGYIAPALREEWGLHPAQLSRLRRGAVRPAARQPAVRADRRRHRPQTCTARRGAGVWRLHPGFGLYAIDRIPDLAALHHRHWPRGAIPTCITLSSGTHRRAAAC